MSAVLIRSHRAAVSYSSSNALLQFTRTVSSRQCIFSHHNLPSLSTTPSCAVPCITSQRHTSSTSYQLHSAGDKPPTTADLHSLYHDQMKEIQSEREAIFGTTDDDASDSPDLSQAAKSYFTSKENTAQPPSLPPSSAPSEPTIDSTPQPQFLPPGWNSKEEIEAAYEEREAIYDFSDEDKTSWTNNNAGTSQIKPSHIHFIQESIKEARTKEETNTQQQQSSSASPSPFSHLTPQGDGVSMVDVGHKTASHRVALARSVVVFPPEVLSAFQVNDSKSEMVGPKGPIFETAKIAGIMGAKKTSDLIPLCHPLPLDRVNINIQLIHNQAIIECECRVTHKTGVEMEALMGATIAALTIYDMVKAVSHRVEIGQTVLVSKSGGKSGDFVHS